MKRLLVFAAVACVTLLAATPAFAAQDREIKEADGCGYVVDTTGSVVPEATVKATSGDKTVATATTLSDGSFHFEESINSQVTLTISAKGFAPATDTVDHVKSTKSDNKCKRPVYVVLAQGNGMSFITTKKKNVPRTK
jgi:hypothetical protein